jgi:hypothetical protein
MREHSGPSVINKLSAEAVPFGLCVIKINADTCCLFRKHRMADKIILIPATDLAAKYQEHSPNESPEWAGLLDNN